MKLVLVEWVDSQRGATEWTYPGDHDGPRSSALRNQSVGWVWHKSKEAIVLVHNIGDKGKQVLFRMTIPMCSVRSIRRLR